MTIIKKHADPVIIFYYVYQNRFLFFCSFLRTLNRFGLAIIISISKILVKKSTDPKLNLPLSRRLSFLRCSFSCSIGQLIFVVFFSFLFLFSSSEEKEGDRVRFLDATRSTRFFHHFLLRRRRREIGH